MAKQVLTPASSHIAHASSSASAHATGAHATPLGPITPAYETTNHHFAQHGFEARSNHDQRGALPSAGNAATNNDHDRNVVAVSFLKPRVAAALGVPRRWHPLLYACRLLTIGPSLWWGARIALRFLITELVDFSDPSGAPRLADLGADPGTSLRLIESSLVFVWVRNNTFFEVYIHDLPADLLLRAHK